MWTDRTWFLLAVAAYGLSAAYSVLLWRKGFRRDDRVNYLLLLAGFAGHTLAVLQRGFLNQRCPVYNIYEAATFFTWFSVAAILVIGLWPRFRFLGAFAAPVFFALGFFALMPGLDPARGAAPDYTGGLRSMHTAVTLLACASFGLGCAAGLMLLTQERNLKRRRVNALMSLLPPMSRIDAALGGLMFAGLLLLTLGLAAGIAFFVLNQAQFRGGGDSKIAWSVLVWLGYAAMQIARWRGWLRGRRLAFAAIGGFLLVALTFLGTNLLSPLHGPPPAPAPN